MNKSTPQVSFRAAALAVVATGSVAGLGAVLLPSVDLERAQPFSALLSQCCSVVLLGCALWAWSVTVVVLAEALRAPSGSTLAARRRGVPSGYRRLVLSACGLALAAGGTAPAIATPGPTHLDTHAVATATAPVAPRGPMHVPSHQQAGPRATPRASTDIVVRPGDSLWRLSAERLPENADDATITHTWQRLYETNSRLIGDDPDHIEPGQRLARPEGW